MRLTRLELEAIGSCARRAFGPECVVRVFGSRTDDSRHGGDIDLHVVAPKRLATLTNEIAFKLDLKDRIGEQRVDVVLRPEAYVPGPIDEVAELTGIVIL